MKRDARIGLAVVLVLGLSITLLVGRAIYKRGGDASLDADNDVAAAAPTTTNAGFDDSASSGTGTSFQLPSPDTGSFSGSGSSITLPSSHLDLSQEIDGKPPRMLQSFDPVPSSGTTGPRRRTGDNKPAPDDADHDADVAPLSGGSKNTRGDSAPPADGYGYTCVAGDNMWKISTKVFGDGRFANKIKEANGTDKLVVGKIIKIPAIPNKTLHVKLESYADATKTPNRKSAEPKTVAPVPASAVKESPKVAVAEGTTSVYRVQTGDTLAAIAKKYYGSSGPKSVGHILAANPGVDPTRLKANKELVIPAKNW